MRDITKEDLIQSHRITMLSGYLGLLLGALIVAVPVMATYPDKNYCVQEISNEN